MLQIGIALINQNLLAVFETKCLEKHNENQKCFGNNGFGQETKEVHKLR
jgi:hypothetical protein